jgi:hypothetical protein
MGTGNKLDPTKLCVSDISKTNTCPLAAVIRRELKRRGIHYSFGAGTFWGWCILGSLIGVGPLVYMHKLFKAVNKINADYNVNG